MQSSYTPEQEAQLSRWGCPESRWTTDPGCDEPILERQPHDVLAWLESCVDGRLFLEVLDGKWMVISADYGSHRAADPYAATFALAQAVMEAK